jgi:hypothetical protein
MRELLLLTIEDVEAKIALEEILKDQLLPLLTIKDVEKEIVL